MRTSTLRFAAVAAIAAGITLTTPAAAAAPPHGSCAGGANQLPQVGLPAPGPLLGPVIAAAAQGEAGSVGGPGIGEEVANTLAVICDPQP
jgi:hypothetical protein